MWMRRRVLKEPGESDEGCKSKGKGKAIPAQAYIGTVGSKSLILPGNSLTLWAKFEILRI